jgi:hypothetical protein
MLNQDMLTAAVIWGLLSLLLLLLWACLGFVLQKIGLFSDTIAQRRTTILSAFRWVWLLPLHITWIILVLAVVME